MMVGPSFGQTRTDCIPLDLGTGTVQLVAQLLEDAQLVHCDIVDLVQPLVVDQLG